MSERKHLWVDDIRRPVQPFDVATTYKQAIDMIDTGMYTDIHLDHDLADFDQDGREWTGYDVVKHLCERAVDGKSVPVRYFFLTNNPTGRRNMEALINRYLNGTIMKGVYEYTVDENIQASSQSEEGDN